MAEKTYLIVKEHRERGFPLEVVDMTIVLNDISQNKLIEAVNLEYERLRKKYSAGKYEIQEVYSDRFPEPQYLAERKLSEVRKLPASEILKDTIYKKGKN